ncbi:MAG: hypothetical protein Q8O93_00135 [bacterium]|nr:hypothetical protein [bacterium]
MSYKSFIITYWHWLILIIAAVIFFIGVSSFNYYAQSENFIKFLSPDESANYTFAKLYAQESRTQFFEKYNILAGDVIHPRSYRSDFGWLKPVSFLGIILIYGKIAGVIGYQILPYLTPLFAALGIIFYYLSVKIIFGRSNALISALMLTAFPPYIYYSARSMFHNVLFMVLVLAAFYFAMIAAGRHKAEATAAGAYRTYFYAALGGSMLGLAVITRASELIWLLPVWLIIWLVNIKKIGAAKSVIFIAFFLFALVPALFWNKILYQSYWRGGYNEMNQSILVMAGAGADLVKSGLLRADEASQSLAQIKNNFFHFGFQPLKSLNMLYYYFIKMFYWIFWPALLGFLLMLKKIKKWRRRHYVYFSAYLTASAILLLYYGSWDFHDNPDPKSFTIGNSYARYWLPIYMGAIPLVSVLLVKLSNLFRKKYLIYGFRLIIIALMFFISLKFVLAGSEEGLISSAKRLSSSKAEYDRLLSLTESRAVIITQYHDKLIFPQRKVIVGLFNDDNMIAEYAALAKVLPVYYYNFTFPKKDIEYLNNRKLADFGLRIERVEAVAKNFTLYRLSARE